MNVSSFWIAGEKKKKRWGKVVCMAAKYLGESWAMSLWGTDQHLLGCNNFGDELECSFSDLGYGI